MNKKLKIDIFIAGVWIGIMFMIIFGIEEVGFWEQLWGFFAFVIFPMSIGYNLKNYER